MLLIEHLKNGRAWLMYDGDHSFALVSDRTKRHSYLQREI